MRRDRNSYVRRVANPATHAAVAGAASVRLCRPASKAGPRLRGQPDQGLFELQPVTRTSGSATWTTALGQQR
eukprot:3077190-Alexandrium_andersonii.AAC.1